MIPGQVDEALSSFEARFARELGAQHARVDLFVRSKADEFRRRLSEYFYFLFGLQDWWIGTGVVGMVRGVDKGIEMADKGLGTGNWTLRIGRS